MNSMGYTKPKYTQCRRFKSLRNVADNEFKLWSKSSVWNSLYQYINIYRDMICNRIMVGCILFNVPLENLPFIYRHHRRGWRATQFRPMFGTCGPWAGRDIYHASLSLTRDVCCCSIIRRITLSTRLLRHTRSTENVL